MSRVNVHALLRRMQIATKRLARSGTIGDYKSAFKGSGMEFHQLREYQPGDDVRHIDWYSAAKTEKLMVRQFVQEQDRTIFLLVDVSASMDYASGELARRDLVLEIAASLITLAHQNNDKIGLVLFSDKIERFIAPARGNMFAILETIQGHHANHAQTDIRSALMMIMRMTTRDAVVFVISDWIQDMNQVGKLLKVAAKRHDIIAVRLVDPCEKSLNVAGMFEVQDPESGEWCTLRTNSGYTLNGLLASRLIEGRRLFEGSGIDLVDITVGEYFVPILCRFLHKRALLARSS